MKTLFLIVIFSTSFNFSIGLDGMLGKITSGFKFVGQYLGLDQASEVAQLVAEAFRKTTGRRDEDDQENVFSGFLRVFGFDTKKIGAIAVNTVIFVAQLISSSLAKRSPPQLSELRDLKEENPLDWIMNNSRISDTLEYAKTADLPSNIIEYIKDNSLDEETDCIQLLICKTAPFINGVQKALQQTKEKKKTGKQVLFDHLPTLEEVAVAGDECERKHQYCSIHD